MLDAIDAHTCEFDTEGMTDKERQDVYNAVTRQVERLNKLLIISEKWSLENGILTPTNKIKRNVIHETYKHLFEDWYNAKNKIIVKISFK